MIKEKGKANSWLVTGFIDNKKTPGVAGDVRDRLGATQSTATLSYRTEGAGVDLNIAQDFLDGNTGIDPMMEPKSLRFDPELDKAGGLYQEGGDMPLLPVGGYDQINKITNGVDDLINIKNYLTGMD